LIVLPEACVLVEVVDDFVASDQDQGLGGDHHQRGNDPKQIKQSSGATMSEKCTIFFVLHTCLVNNFYNTIQYIEFQLGSFQQILISKDANPKSERNKLKLF
jgi:hypothetical protein